MIRAQRGARAERLHVTPVGREQRARPIAEVLGDPLVTRKGRAIVPTPAGNRARARDCPRHPRIRARAPGRSLRRREVHANVLSRGRRCRPDHVGSADRHRDDAGAAQSAPTRRRIDSLVSLGDLTSSEIDLHLGTRAGCRPARIEPLFEERVVLVARRDTRRSATGSRAPCSVVCVTCASIWCLEETSAIASPSRMRERASHARS